MNHPIQEIIDGLNGTCKTLSYVCGYLGIEENDITPEEAALIDNEIFECDTCGWWCDQDESNETDNGKECGDCVDNEINGHLDDPNGGDGFDD